MKSAGTTRRTLHLLERRTFLALVSGGFLAAPLAAEAQQRAGKPPRIGWLTSSVVHANNVDAFREGMRALGYPEVNLEFRAAAGQVDRLSTLAAELLALNVEVIVTDGGPAAFAAKHATATLPIVIGATAGDLVQQGLVASLARPGGNVTGFTLSSGVELNVTGLSAFATEIQGKQLELLREAVPRIARIAFLFNMSNPVLQAQWKEAESVARSVGLQPQLLDVRTVRDLEPAFDAAMRQRAGAVIVGIDALTEANREQIDEAAARRQLPAISREREFPDAGGLMSYGVHYPDSYRRAAVYVDKIFKGARPADLPVQQPTKLELIINLKTAKALGLTIPQSLLLRADEIIQ